MRWKSDLKAAECCAASEDESGSLRSSDEVGHADSSVVEVGASRAGDQSIKGGRHREQTSGGLFSQFCKSKGRKKKREAENDALLDLAQLKLK